MEGEKGIERTVEKAAGDEGAFIPSRASSWQIEGLRRHGEQGSGERVMGPLSRKA
jgi:hypothetical protein